MRFIGIAGQDTMGEMNTFVEDLDLAGFEHVADGSGEVWRAFEISAQPSFVFINDDGQITRNIGALTADEFISEIDRLLAS